jgi:hypothetical protein
MVIGINGSLSSSGTNVTLTGSGAWFIESLGGSNIALYMVDASNTKYYLSFANTNNGTGLVATPNPANATFVMQPT